MAKRAHVEPAPFPVLRKTALLLLMVTVLGGFHATGAPANPEIYSVLPDDTRILQYTLAELDGEAPEELAILYTTAGRIHMTFFKGDSGHWSRWWDDDGILTREDGNVPLSMEAADVNGDDRAEILTYYLTEDRGAMSARILSLADPRASRPVFEILLEDATAPPGYPVLGVEKESFSITFLRMASREHNGHRRVYCWNGEAFEKCLEIIWEKP